MLRQSQPEVGAFERAGRGLEQPDHGDVGEERLRIVERCGVDVGLGQQGIDVAAELGGELAVATDASGADDAHSGSASECLDPIPGVGKW